MEVPIPADANVGTFADAALVSLRSDWTVGGQTFKQGSMFSLPFSDLMKGDVSAAQILFEPTDSKRARRANASRRRRFSRRGDESRRHRGCRADSPRGRRAGARGEVNG